MAKECPQGIDAFFNNTSGAIHDAVMPLIARGSMEKLYSSENLGKLVIRI